MCPILDNRNAGKCEKAKGVKRTVPLTPIPLTPRQYINKLNGRVVILMFFIDISFAIVFIENINQKGDVS